MAKPISTYHQEILDQLETLHSELGKLKKENVRLRAETETFKQKLDSSKNDALGQIDENDRIALKNQLGEYIHRIDQILEQK